MADRVPVIRGADHLSRLLDGFGTWYNSYRGHTTLGGAPPGLVYRGERSNRPPKTAKTLSFAIERRVFADTRVTAYRLAA